MDANQQGSRQNYAPQPTKKRRLATEERQRAVRACDSCRRLKERCIGGVPCERCRRYDRVCEFSDDLPKNLNPTPSTARSNIDDLRTLQQRAIYMEKILKHYHPKIELDLESLRLKTEGLDSTVAIPQDDEASSAGEAALAIEDENYNINVVDETIAHYSGEFSYWNFSERIKQHVKALTTDAQFSNGQDPSHIPHYWRVEELYSDVGEVVNARSSFPPHHIATFLIHTFFRHAVTNYFYVERAWLERRVEALYTNPSQLKTGDAGTVAVALAVFAVGTQYAHLESPPESKDSRNTAITPDDQIGVIFYQSAARLLPQIVHLASLESVQACLLFGLYALPIDASGLAYIYLNLAIKLAMQNGLHRRSSSHTFGPETLEIRNRVWWTLHCTERKISIFHGRPVSVLLSNIDTDEPVLNQYVDNLANSSSDLTLPLMVKMARSLEDFYDELVLLRKCQKSSLSSILSRICSKKDAFRKWWESTSPGTLSKRYGLQSRFSRSNAHCVLEYCLIRMFVGRPFLLSRTGSGSITSASPKASPPNTAYTTSSADKDSTRSSRVPTLVDDCVQAALEVVEVCQSMRENGTRLAKFSYIEYSACRASLLVLIAFCIRNQTDQFYFQLRKGLKIIRELTASDSAKCEVRLIHALERAVERLPLSGKQSSAPPFDGNNSATNYNNFKQWLSRVQAGEVPPNDPDDDHVRSANVTTQDATEPHQTSSANASTQYLNALHNVGIEGGPHELPNMYTGFEYLQSAAGSAFFDLESFGPMLALPANPERQLIEDFLAMPHHNYS